MKIELIDNLQSNICNSNVRWYLSSQEIWIGEEKDYQEIEKSIGKSYGSFKWLFSGADTILFDKVNLTFTTGVIKVNEPINVIEGNLEFININNREGTIKLIEANNSSCELSDCTIYYSNEDVLVSYRGNLELDDQIIVFSITKDFSFIVKDKALVGWILKNSSSHITKDEINYIDSAVQSTGYTADILVKYLNLINKLSEELTSEDEEKLINDFKTLYECIKTCTLPPIVAIKENILNVIDFM